MSKILVCQHVAYEILGTLNPLIKSHGFRIRYVNFDRHPDATPELEGYRGLIILGGPMNVDQSEAYPHLIHEMRLIEAALEKDIPVLGICLGAQLIAKALGSRVGPGPEKEIGWYRLRPTKEGQKDPLISHFNESEQIFQWHGDTFDIPKQAVHLASGEGCCPNQAFRYGDKVYGFQFHLEVDEAMIMRWLQVPFHLNELAKLQGKIDPEVIREETPHYIEDSMRLSKKVFGGFVDLVGKKKKLLSLPSR